MASPAGATGFFKQQSKDGRYRASSCARITGGFEYIGPALDPCEARAILSSECHTASRAQAADLALAIVRRYPGATSPLVARMLGVSTPTATKILVGLAEAGKIVPAGHGRKGDPRAFYLI